MNTQVKIKATTMSLVPIHNIANTNICRPNVYFRNSSCEVLKPSVTYLDDIFKVNITNPVKNLLLFNV